MYSSEQWRLDLHLLNSVFEESWDGPGCRISYDKHALLLSFRYRHLDEIVFDIFCADFDRVRAIVCLSRGLSENMAKRWSLCHTSPTSLTLSGDGIVVEVGCSEDSYTVTLSPKGPAMESLCPLVEEVLNGSGASCGQTLASLLDRACPVAAAIDEATPHDPAQCRVGFTMCLRARIVLGGRDAKSVVIDIDRPSLRGPC